MNKQNKWVHWMKMGNISLKEKPSDVVVYLRGKGLMQPDGFWPTEDAIKKGWAKRITKEDGKIKSVWNKLMYINTTKNERREQRRAGEKK